MSLDKVKTAVQASVKAATGKNFPAYTLDVAEDVRNGVTVGISLDLFAEVAPEKTRWYGLNFSNWDIDSYGAQRIGEIFIDRTKDAMDRHRREALHSRGAQ